MTILDLETKENLRIFLLSILDDEEGISENSWEILRDYLQAIGEINLIKELTNLVKSCNGRRYIDKDIKG